MTAPIRAKVHALVEFPKEPAEMTLREGLEWFKKSVRELDGEMLRPLEQKYLNERWALLVDGIAKREGVPTGSLSYYLGEMAHAEIGLAEVGEAESQAAQMYQ
jgi:hypothetical protein